MLITCTRILCRICNSDFIKGKIPPGQLLIKVQNTHILNMANITKTHVNTNIFCNILPSLFHRPSLSVFETHSFIPSLTLWTMKHVLISTRPNMEILCESLFTNTTLKAFPASSFFFWLKSCTKTTITTKNQKVSNQEHLTTAMKSA